MSQPAGIGVPRGAALYVGALMGPGVLLVPSLATQAAGPAVVVAWVALLALSVPLAVTFAALGVRHPVAGGVAEYVRAAFGTRWAAVTGSVFLTAIVVGAPAVSLIGGFYVADLAGGGRPTAVGAAVAMFAAVLCINAVGVRLSSRVQLGLSAMLVVTIVVAIAVAVPGNIGDNWTPFAPHGLGGIGTAAAILMWLFVGWEAMAQLAGDFSDPARQLPRSVAIAYGVIVALYVGLAVATITVTAGEDTEVPLADLLAAGFGAAGRDATAVLAVVLTMGTMNVYVGAGARLAGARGLPRPLPGLALLGGVVLAALAAGVLHADDLVRATSACFVVVYVLALGAGARILDGTPRRLAAGALAAMLVIAGFSGWYLLLPLAAAAVTLLLVSGARASSAA